MGQASGMTGGQIGMGLLQGGLQGLSQGLQQRNSRNPQFNFSQMQQQPQRPALGQGATPNAAKRPVNNTFDPSSYAGGQFPWSG